MAADLKVLIRLGEWQVDEKRRALGLLFSLRETLGKQALDLEAELEREQQAASFDALASLHYGTFAAQVIERRDRIAESIERMEQEIARAQDDLAEAFRDLKKYEIAELARTKREAAALAREEQLVLDEIGQEAYRRKLAGNS